MKFVKITEENYNQVAQIYKEGLATNIATFETKVPNWETWNFKYLLLVELPLLKINWF